MSDMQAGHSQTPVDDEIDLKELFMVLWSGKWLITAVTGIAAVTSVVIALMLPNIYTANALLGARRAVRWRYECTDAAVWGACKFGWCVASRWRGGVERASWVWRS